MAKSDNLVNARWKFLHDSVKGQLKIFAIGVEFEQYLALQCGQKEVAKITLLLLEEKIRGIDCSVFQLLVGDVFEGSLSEL